jgi:hypothetical protein
LFRAPVRSLTLDVREQTFRFRPTQAIYRLMNVVVQVQLPDDLKSAIDRQVAARHARSDADFLLQAARLCAAELDEDQDLWTMAQAGIGDAETGRYTLIETEADDEALHERTMAPVRANLAPDKQNGCPKDP